MTNEDWTKNFQKLTELSNLATEKQIEFYRSILVAGAGILGILISLHSTQTSCLYIRWVFLLSVYLLLLGVLLSAIVLRDLSLMPERTKKAFLICTPRKKRTAYCERWCLISLLSSFLLLTIYATLSILY